MSAILDSKEEAVLLGIRKNQSITEISEENDISVGGVHNILTELEESSLINPPAKKGQHRARSITDAGLSYLVGKGLISVEVFRE